MKPDTVTLPKQALQDIIHCVLILAEMIEEKNLTPQELERLEYAATVSESIVRCVADFKKLNK